MSDTMHHAVARKQFRYFVVVVVGWDTYGTYRSESVTEQDLYSGH